MKGEGSKALPLSLHSSLFTLHTSLLNGVCVSIATSLLPEFDHEMKVTRTLLERVPDDRADWKPHPKSYSVGDLATHIANLGYWMILSIRESEIDVDPPGGLDRPQFGSTVANLERFDRNVTEARQLLQNM